MPLPDDKAVPERFEKSFILTEFATYVTVFNPLEIILIFINSHNLKFRLEVPVLLFNVCIYCTVPSIFSWKKSVLESLREKWQKNRLQ